MKTRLFITACLFTLWSEFSAHSACAAEAPGDDSLIISTPGLVAYWDFNEAPGQPRISEAGIGTHALQEVHGPIARKDEGPFSGHCAYFDGSQWLKIPYQETGALNISGATAQVTVVAFVKLERVKSTIAGMWSEGEGAHDDTGTRQYALLLDMPAYGGTDNVTPHISAEGGVTQRADGSKFPWNVDYAASVSTIETGTWISVGFTYDSEYIKAYYNGICEPRELNPEQDRRTDPYFTSGGPNGTSRGMNPYYHGRGIFQYDPNQEYDPPKISPSDFMVGARYAVGSFTKEALKGCIGGLAVYNRALSDAEMLAIHQAANLPQLNAPSNDR